MDNQTVKTILLVEDEVLIAMAQELTIKRFGYNAVSAYSGEEAVKAACENQEIALILMDIDLGRGIDGTEAARRILRKRNIPVVFLTSHSEREMVEKVRGITRYGYVIKNSGDFVLQSSIEMALELYRANEETHQNELLLSQKVEALERFKNLTVDRELQMIELKKEINALLKQIGEPEKHKIIQ
jgi:CheY-like chemotaxis protein